MARPGLILAGYGSGHPLQITIESERALARATRVFAVGLPRALARHLEARRSRCVDLSACFEEGRPYAEAYLDVAAAVLRQASLDPPVAFLSEGAPLLSNALNRFLVAEARRLGIATTALPAVSPIDSLICQLGLDVTAFGLQVFDARRVFERSMPVQASVPLLLLQLGSLAAGAEGGLLAATEAAYAPLADYLARIYQPSHAVVHLANSAEAHAEPIAVAPLSAFMTLLPRIGPASTLFVDRVRPSAGEHNQGGQG